MATFTCWELINIAADDPFNIVGIDLDADAYIFFDQQNGNGHFIKDGMQQPAAQDIRVLRGELGTTVFFHPDDVTDFLSVKADIPGELFVPMVLDPGDTPPNVPPPPGGGPVIGIVAADADKLEGDAGGTAFTFTATRSGVFQGTHSATWTVSTGTNPGADAADFVGGIFPTGTVTFGPGETTKTVTVLVQGDTAQESGGTAEDFVVTLSNPTDGAAIDPAHPDANGHIQNDDGGNPPPGDDYPADAGTSGQALPDRAIAGELESVGDRDWFLSPMIAITSYFVHLEGIGVHFGTLVDPYLRLRDGNGQLLAEDDDTGPGQDSLVLMVPSVSGNYYIEVGSFDDDATGTYQVSVTTLRPVGHAADIDGDGTDDVLFQNVNTGQVYYARMAGGVLQGWGAVTGTMSPDWKAIAAGNVNGGAGAEVFVQQQSTGTIYFASVDTGATTWGVVTTSLTFAWKLRAAADVNGDGSTDAIVQDEFDGTIYYADMQGGAFHGWKAVAGTLGFNWVAVGADDINGDGFADVVVQDQADGTTYYANMANGQFSGWNTVATSLTAHWQVRGVADVTGDGFADVVFQNLIGSGVAPGTTYYVDMANGAHHHWGVVAANLTGDWIAEGTSDLDDDGLAEMLFQNVAGIGAPPGTTYFANVNGAGQNLPSWGSVTSSITGDWQVV